MFKKTKLWIASFLKRKEVSIEGETIKEVSVDGETIDGTIIGTKPAEEKKVISTYHAKERLEQRHGIVLTEAMSKAFINDIRNENAQFLEITKNNTEAWVVSYNNKKYRIIYNPDESLIVTIYSCIKDKKIKPSRRKKKKIQKRANLYNASVKKGKRTLKKPYKRNKRNTLNDEIH